MDKGVNVLHRFHRIYRAAQRSDDGNRCMVAPHPDLQLKLRAELESFAGARNDVLRSMTRIVQPTMMGFNDGVIIPPNEFPLGTPPRVIRSAAAARAPLRGAVRVIVVLVDFSDQAFNAAHTRQHFEQLFFSQGAIPTKSVREYFEEATNGLIDIRGEVVGPFRLPRKLADYAHGESGTGLQRPNAQTMARDAVIAADTTVSFGPYDNDGNGFVDAFIVVHAGPGAEVTGDPGHIWSHKWVLDGGALSVDGTKIFAYLTVPEDAKIGVCCHELCHLLFGFPDLYDTDGSSHGIGDWCLMAGGSWGGGGDTPVHPSAWCKANQGWVTVDNLTQNTTLQVDDVKQSHRVYRLWRKGEPSTEYFLAENRQWAGFDNSLPGAGLLVWHIDETISTNSDENRLKVALIQADGKRDLEKLPSPTNAGGDPGDPYPGSTGNRQLTANSNPNTRAYSGLASGVSLTEISDSGPSMSMKVGVRPGAIPPSPNQPAGPSFAELAGRIEVLEDTVSRLTSGSPAAGGANLSYDGAGNDGSDSDHTFVRELARVARRYEV